MSNKIDRITSSCDLSFFFFFFWILFWYLPSHSVIYESTRKQTMGTTASSESMMDTSLPFVMRREPLGLPHHGIRDRVLLRLEEGEGLRIPGHLEPKDRYPRLTRITFEEGDSFVINHGTAEDHKKFNDRIKEAISEYERCHRSAVIKLIVTDRGCVQILRYQGDEVFEE